MATKAEIDFLKGVCATRDEVNACEGTTINMEKQYLLKILDVCLELKMYNGVLLESIFRTEQGNIH